MISLNSIIGLHYNIPQNVGEYVNTIYYEPTNKQQFIIGGYITKKSSNYFELNVSAIKAMPKFFFESKKVIKRIKKVI